MDQFSENDDIMMLEGHRPVERQIMDMIRVGFKMNSKKIRRLKESLYLNGNPHQILPNSRILMFTLGSK